MINSKKIRLKTKDGTEIAGDYSSIENKSAPAVVLIHMMPATKESWKNITRKLNEEGFQCLAIDLRGHGESQGGPDGFRDFNDEQNQENINDVEAAVDFFTTQGLPLENITLMGASIGANLSLQFQSNHQEIKASVLLSPGLNYFGIETESAIKKLNDNQSIFLVAGGENDEYSSETVVKLFNLAKLSNKEKRIYQNAGHGTIVLREEPLSMDEIISWLKNIYYGN